ncbi:hypothetical protein L3056_11080 [Corynebacterium sp. MC-25]|nr:hypothetical protein [Corynebacterium parakroppenstedtii]
MKDMVLNASPMHIINLISPLSGVAFARNTSKLSPIAHLVTREEFFVFETFTEDFGTTRNDSPKSELDFKLLELKDGGEMALGDISAVEC